MTVTVWPVDAVTGAPSYTGRALREAMSAQMAGASTADPFGVRSGVRPGTSPTTVTATSTTWTIAAHAGFLDLESAVEASGYAYAINATGGLPSGAVTAADATRPRVDIVWVRLDDPAESDGSSVPAVVAGYTAGAPNATPSAPATPARCMVLATIQVPLSGGGAPTVIWVAPYTVAAGGVLPVPAGVRPANPYVGQYVDDATLGLMRYNGTAWVTPTLQFESFGGTALWGTYDATKPIRHFLGRKVGTSDASGYVAPSVFPSGVTAVLTSTLGNTNANQTIVLASVSGTAANYQVRNAISPFSAMAAWAYDFSHDIAYQV